MAKTWQRALIVTGSLLLAAGSVSACGSERSAEAWQAQKYAKEYNQAIAPLNAQNAAQVEQMQAQLQGTIPSGLLPAPVWQMLKNNPVSARQLAAELPVLKILKQQLGNKSGFTEADLRKDVEQQVKQGQLAKREYSTDFIDLYRVMKASSILQQGQQIPGLDMEKLSREMTQAQSRKPARYEGKLDQNLSSLTQGMPVYQPNLAAGVKLQGLEEDRKLIADLMQQQMQQQMQQMIPQGK